MRRTDIAVGAFLINDVAILKLYNTYFRRTEARRETVLNFWRVARCWQNCFCILREYGLLG